MTAGLIIERQRGKRCEVTFCEVCGGESRHVVWAWFEDCQECRDLIADAADNPATALAHIHLCSHRGHVHLCESCYSAWCGGDLDIGVNPETGFVNWVEDGP